MSALSIQVPFPVFQDRDGQPLDNGYVWLGTSSLNPQTNPVVAYYDSALTIVATQPLRTLNGFISRAGSPAQVYVDAVNFSILVQDRQGTTVFSVPEGTGISPNASGVVYDPAGTGAVATTVQAKLRESVSIFDFIPVAEHAAIQLNTSTYDCTTAIAAAIAHCSFLIGGGGSYGFEKVLRFPHGTYCVKYIDVTARRNVWLYAEGYVTIKGVDSSVKPFVFGSTNFNSATPASSTQTPECFVGGPGQWEFTAAAATSYQLGLRLEHFTSSHFENVSSGSGYITVNNVDISTTDRIACYLQYSYSNLFINCSFSCASAPPVGGVSIGLMMGNNNNNSNSFIRCNWQGAGVSATPYTDTIGVHLAGSNNFLDNCDLSTLGTAIRCVGKGSQIRNVYSEAVVTFFTGASGGQSFGTVVQGGLIEILNAGTAFVLLNCENTTIIGGHYKGSGAGTKTFISQNATYGVTVIQPNLVSGTFTNFITGTYNGASTVNLASVLQTNWLSFPATQTPSTDVNTLDDYEEGTWTPTKTTGTAFTTASGRYTKIGNLVTITFQVAFAVEVSASIAAISGVPIAASGAASELNGLAIGYNTSAVALGGTLATTTITLRINGGDRPTITQMSGATLSGTMTYTVV